MAATVATRSLRAGSGSCRPAPCGSSNRGGRGGAGPDAVYFSRSQLYFITNEEIVARCWDLKGLNREYARFLKKIEPAHDEARSGLRSGQPLAPAECFRRGVWLAFGSSQF